MNRYSGIEIVDYYIGTERRNLSMSENNLKEKKPSLIDFTRKYANNPKACLDWFIHAFYPYGFTCPECGCHTYRMIRNNSVLQCTHCSHQSFLFAGTIFQDNKLDLYKLLLGLYLFFSSNKGMSAVEMRSYLNVNYKTACLLCRKCRILMQDEETTYKLNSLFYEADGAFIGSRKKGTDGKKRQGNATAKQSFFAVLSTGEENKYPHQIKLFPIKIDNSATTLECMQKAAILSPERKLNTDKKNTFNVMKDYLQVRSEVVDYDNLGHRLHWLNVLIGDIKNQITGIYHGVAKRDLPLFLVEQQYRFNHRNHGQCLYDRIAKYLFRSTPHPRKLIVAALNDNSSAFISD